MNTRYPLFLFLVLPLELANATTYYVDASAGDDKWSGKLSVKNAAPSTDGPWATLDKISKVSLVPGDSVLLKCGQRWNQTLHITSSGVSGNPISFGVYPSGCSTPPEINGGTLIPAKNWVKHSGNIYSATLPLNYISNSTFNTDFYGWGKYSANNDAALLLSTSCQTGAGNCLTFSASSTTGLAISPPFEVTAGNNYQLKFAANIPSGKTVYAIVRRHGAPYDAVAQAIKLTGTGAWQNYTYPITAKISMPKARLDFEVSAGVAIRLDNVKLETTALNGLGIFENGREVNVAHHPNRGYDPITPESLYYKTAANSDAVTSTATGQGSTYVVPGTGLILPSGATLTPGTGIRIRSRNWTLNERTVASFDGTRIILNEPTSGQVLKDWGYFLLGKLWMLDEPRESFYDAASGKAYIWMSDNQVPGDRVRVGQIETGIDINSISYVTVNGLAIRNTVLGVRLNKTNNLTFSNMLIEDVLGRGVDAINSADISISNSRIARTGRAAISGVNGGFGLTRFTVDNNDISETGVQLTNGKVSSLPMNVIGGTVQVGDYAVISNNSIRATNYIGTYSHQGGSILNNHIEDTCLILDDCGAIYLTVLGKDSVVRGNTVARSYGSSLGKPSSSIITAQGIYLDYGAANITVADNTITDVYDGIHLYNGSNNFIEGNTFYRNRRYNIWMQETSNKVNVNGDLFDNTIVGNYFYPSVSKHSPIRLETSYYSSTDAADYNSNRYFTMLAPHIASENSLSQGTAIYTLKEWQSDTTSDGVPRYLDPLAIEVNSTTAGNAIYLIVSNTNLISNGNLTNGKTGWGAYNNINPQGQLDVIDCATGKCLKYVSGGGTGSIISPNFSVIKDRWYRLSFDLLVNTTDQILQMVLRRGGGGSNSYETLDNLPHSLTGSTTWRRYSALFKALKTVNANDPVTQDLGARIDFEGIKSGVTATLANVELVTINNVDQTVHTNILVNPSNVALDLGCPFTGDQSYLCGQLHRFSDSQPVIWPYRLEPHKSEIIYNLDSKLIDADKDGIANSQDACASTAQGLGVNARGCSLNQ